MPAPLPFELLRDNTADPAGYFAKGAQLGLAEAAQQAQMMEFAQRQQMAQQELAMQGQKLQMDAEENKLKHLEAQQALAIDKTYRDMQLTAQKRQLDMAGQVMQARAKQMSDQFAAEEEFKKTHAALQQQHPDWAPEKVFSTALFSNPLNIGRLPPGIVNAAVNIPKQAFVPQNMTTKDGTKLVELSPGRWAQEKSTQDTMSPWERMRLDFAQDEIKKIEDDIRNRNLKGKRLEERRKEEEQYKVIMNNIYRQKGQQVPHPELESSGTSFKYDAKGNLIPVGASKESSEPSFKSDVWNFIKSAPENWRREAGKMGDTIRGAITGEGEDMPTESNVIPQAPVVPPSPAWPSQEQQEPQAFPAPNFNAVPAAGGVALPQSMVPKLQERAVVGIGKALRSPIGKSLADIFEGIAGMSDLSSLGAIDLQRRVKSLRDDILEVTK